MDRFLFCENAFPFLSALTPCHVRVGVLGGGDALLRALSLHAGVCRDSPRGRGIHIFLGISFQLCALTPLRVRVGRLEKAPRPGSPVPPLTAPPTH